MRSKIYFLLLLAFCAFTLQARQVNLTLNSLQPGTLAQTIGKDTVILEGLTIKGGVITVEDLQVIPQMKNLKTLDVKGCSLADAMNATIPGGIFSGHSALAVVTLPGNARQLASGAFSSMPSLSTVVLPEDLTHIEMSCFNSCKNLETINFPKALTVVGWSAFQGCEKLKKVHLGLKLNELRGYAFNGCSALEEVIIDGSPQNLGEHSFSGCISLKRLELNGTIKEIRKFAFKDDAALVEIRVNATKAPTVGASAFYHVDSDCKAIVPLKSVSKYKKAYGWKSLKLQGSHLVYSVVGEAGNLSSLLVPGNLVDTLQLSGTMNATDVEYIKKNLTAITHLDMKEVSMLSGGTFNGKEWKVSNRMPFQALSSMPVKSVVLPKTIIDVAERCFEDCKQLENVKIGEEVKKIQAGAFLNCKALKKIIIPDAVESVGLSAFSGCLALEQIHFGAAVRKIWNFAFWDCSSLGVITIDDDNEYFAVEENVLFDKKKKELLIYPAAKGEKLYNVPESVTAIGREAFSANQNITKIELQEGLKSIGMGAFANCANLSTVNIPQTLTLLSDEAFRGTALQRVDFIGELEAISTHAFDSCLVLEKIVLNDKINEIEEFAFARCRALKEIRVECSTPADADNAFNNEDGTSSIDFENCVLYVPGEAVEDYRAALGWKQFKTIKPLQQEQQECITMTTAAGVGDYIMLSVEGDEGIAIEGAELKFGGMAVVKDANITIKGHVTSLDCSDSQLTALDVSHATGLKSLWCSNNALEVLNVQPLGSLKILYCTQNQLERLDVTSNAMLEELDCSENHIAEINLKENKKLNRFLCYHNELKSVDVSENKLLIGLDVSENKLSALDVVNNVKLETIYCNGNKIGGEGMASFVKSLPNRNDRTAKCHLFVIDTKNATENNVIFKSQVQQALAKNWQVLNYSAGDNDGAGIDYEGIEETTGVGQVLREQKPMISLLQGILSVNHISPMSQVCVFSLDGTLLKAQVARSGSAVLEGISAAIVIVKVNGKSYKVVSR